MHYPCSGNLPPCFECTGILWLETSKVQTALQEHAPGVLNVLLHLHQELHSFPAIQQPVVVCKGQVHHWADLNLAIDGNRSLLDGVEAKHGALGEVDNGGAHERAKDTTVADGESTTGHILDRELVITRLGSFVSGCVSIIETMEEL